MRGRLAEMADAEVQSFAPSEWSLSLLFGWSETGTITARANRETGFVLVKTVLIQVTDGDGETAVGEWEEWTSGQRGAERRRTLTALPARYRLARKVDTLSPVKQSRLASVVVSYCSAARYNVQKNLIIAACSCHPMQCA